MSKILDMLLDLTKQGYSGEDIKKAVIDLLSPFFDHQEMISQYWCSAEMLSVFEFFIRYHYDHEFEDGVNEVLSLYKAAIKQVPEQTLSIICDTLFDFSQKENIMWTVRENVKEINYGDYDEKVISYMKHIGDILEVGTKHIVLEIWALMQAIDGIIPDYEKIQRLEFGVGIQNILDKEQFVTILMPPPLSIKLSDWRNISYHHTYRIIDEQQILCTYGRKQLSFSITENELLQYVHKIVRSSNILNVVRYIFVFDYSEQIANYISKCGEVSSIRFRKVILENNLRTGMLTQGFYLETINEDSQTIVATIIDLLNDGTFAEEKKKERYIHASQFLYNLWCAYKKEQIKINYISTQHILKFTCSVNGVICERIYNGEKELEYMVQHVNFKFSKNSEN